MKWQQKRQEKTEKQNKADVVGDKVFSQNSSRPQESYELILLPPSVAKNFQISVFSTYLKTSVQYFTFNYDNFNITWKTCADPVVSPEHFQGGLIWGLRKFYGANIYYRSEGMLLCT